MKYHNTKLGRAYNENCFEVMKLMPNGCVDMILADLPYGTTACKWDTIIPFEPMWEHTVPRTFGHFRGSISQIFTEIMSFKPYFYIMIAIHFEICCEVAPCQVVSSRFKCYQMDTGTRYMKYSIEIYVSQDIRLTHGWYKCLS